MAESGLPRVTDDSINKLRSIESERLRRPQKEDSSRVSAGSGQKLNTSGESLLNGIIMAEVLGKPRCLRRGRR